MKEANRYFIERHAGGENAILVQMYFYQKTPDDALQEFTELAYSAGVNVLAVISGKRNLPSPKFYIGKGKAEEVAETVQALNAEVVLINHELSPAQGRNLEALFGCRVLDRTELILDIFAQRAQTHEGKLQVELAQLQHLRTCLVGGWTHLERQKGGIGLRGPGETQLESDRRLLDIRVKSIQKRLEKVVTQREQGRRARKKAELSTVSLVGYTNAGKSTLFNRLTQSHVYVADKLFATLDPTLRHVNIPTYGKIILADTVGFIRDLPHDLVAAFSATLKETVEAELLLHVIDSVNTHRESLINNVNHVLDDIHAGHVPRLLVLNKIDASEKYLPRIDYDSDGLPKRVWVSALTGAGMDLLHQAIAEYLGGGIYRCEIVLGHNEGALRAELYRLKAIISERINEEGCYVLSLELRKADYYRLNLKEKENK